MIFQQSDTGLDSAGDDSKEQRPSRKKPVANGSGRVKKKEVASKLVTNGVA